jgi:Ca2+-binding EF-hand superfamily protein
MFDNDKSGSISVTELKHVCRNMDIDASDEDVKQLVKLMDRDGSGCIDFNEFAEIMADQYYREPTENELRTAFDFFDKGKQDLCLISRLEF